MTDEDKLLISMWYLVYKDNHKNTKKQSILKTVDFGRRNGLDINTDTVKEIIWEAQQNEAESNSNN